MQEVGFNASEQDSLPALHLEVYGFALKNCGQCKTDAYNALIKWATKKITPKQTDMAYKIKPEFVHKDFIFRHKGQILVVNAGNLTQERARMMLANPQYAHAIIGQEELFPEPTDEETSKVTTAETSKEETGPKSSEVATVSTSTEAQNVGSEQTANAETQESKSPVLKPSKAKPGPKPKK